MAIPVVNDKSSGLLDLGILSFTWSSEHYTYESVSSKISNIGFKILESQNLGLNVYVPLADYYFKHRNELQEKIKTKYSSSTEKILFSSLKKMKQMSELGLIDYVLLKCA